LVFLGTDVARKLFSNIPPVGETVRIRGLTFEVVGVMEDKAQLSSYFEPDKECVFVPYTTVKQLFNQDYLDYIVVQSIAPQFHDRAMRQVREVLGERHRFDPRDERALGGNDSAETNAIVGGMSTGLQLVLTFIGTLTLMIGGVGVMNIMLVSVTERTREIGVRKAIGARRRHIVVQFLLEALVITGIGGVVGMALAWTLVQIAGVRPFLADLIGDPTHGTDIHLILSLDVVGVAVGVLMLTGILSGLWPAIRAANVDPIESLHYE
jgi:putative ABC transport system permease protein